MSKSIYAENGAEVASAYTQARQSMSNADAIASVMDEFGITNKRSVTAFLSSKSAGQVYVADTKASVGKASSVRKVQLVKAIAEKFNLDVETIESLEKANKGALEALIASE